MNRRYFIKSGGIALASFGLMTSTPTFLRRALAETIDKVTGGRRKTLIAIFQRGAVDGLNVVVPYGEHSYYDLRPNIAIPKPDGGAESAINLDGYFGLHPSAAVQAAVGFEAPRDRSRVRLARTARARTLTRRITWRSATPGVKSTQDGWLNRYLQSKADPQKSLFRAVSMTQNMPRAMQGKAPTLAISNLADFSIRAGQSSAAMQGGFEAMYDQTVNDALHGTGKETFEAVNY